MGLLSYLDKGRVKANRSDSTLEGSIIRFYEGIGSDSIIDLARESKGVLGIYGVSGDISKKKIGEYEGIVRKLQKKPYRVEGDGWIKKKLYQLSNWESERRVAVLFENKTDEKIRLHKLVGGVVFFGTLVSLAVASSDDSALEALGAIGTLMGSSYLGVRSKKFELKKDTYSFKEGQARDTIFRLRIWNDFMQEVGDKISEISYSDCEEEIIREYGAERISRGMLSSGLGDERIEGEVLSLGGKEVKEQMENAKTKIGKMTRSIGSFLRDVGTPEEV